MSSSKQRVKGESLHLHTTCRSRAKASQGDGDDGVVLNVIQITDVQVLNEQHLYVQHMYGTGDVSSFLIQQGGGEVDGDPAARRHGGGSSGIPTGLRQALREEGDVSWEGEGGARA